MSLRLKSAQDQQREDRVPAGETGSLGWGDGVPGVGRWGTLGWEDGVPGGGDGVPRAEDRVPGRETGSRAVGDGTGIQTGGGSLGRTMPEGLPKAAAGG